MMHGCDEENVRHRGGAAKAGIMGKDSGAGARRRAFSRRLSQGLIAAIRCKAAVID
jgi:hypothetical protein